MFFILSHHDPFSVQLGPRKQLFRGLPIFLRITGLQHKLLRLIKSAKEKESRYGLWGKIWVKLGPMSYFASVLHLK